MTIFFLTPFPSSTLGGIQKHVSVLTEELKKRGHTVIEMSLQNDSKKIPSKFEAWSRLWEKRELIIKADLVHIHDVFWWYLPFRFLFPRKHVFTTFHGWEGEYPPTKPAVFQKRLAARLSVGTIGVGIFFTKWYDVVPDASTFGVLDRTTFFRGKQAELPTRVKTIAFYGRLEPVNGIDVALPALGGLREKGYNILFIGDGSARKEAEEIGMVTGMIATPWQFVLEADLVVTSSYLCMLDTAALARPIVSIATNSLKADYLRTHPLYQHITTVTGPAVLVSEVRSFDLHQRRDNLQRAQAWALAQTPSRLTDTYERLWNKR